MLLFSYLRSRAVGPSQLHSVSKYIRLQYFNRKWATRIDYFILLIIFINCTGKLLSCSHCQKCFWGIFMALEEEIMWVEYTATSIFIMEALFKMLAWGLWGKYVSNMIYDITFVIWDTDFQNLKKKIRRKCNKTKCNKEN